MSLIMFIKSMSKNKEILLYLFLFVSPVFGANQTCSAVKQICIDNSASKSFNGGTFTKEQLGIDCWKYEISYDCPLVDTCQPLLDKGCIIDQAKSICTERNDNGTCRSWNKTANCQNGQSTNKTMIACGNEICKPDSNGTQICYKADPSTDNEFSQAMTALEVANEMGTMKNCYDKNSGAKCSPADPNDPGKGVNPNCQCYFFQGKFITYKDSFSVWGGNCKIGVTATGCDEVAKQFGNNGKRMSLKADNADMPTRNIDVWSDKGQLNSSLTANKNATGIHAGNPYVYSFASSSKQFDPTGKNVTGTDDAWTVANQKSVNYQLATTTESSVISKDDPNSQNNKIHWNTGGSKTDQGSTAKMQPGGAIQVIQDAAKMVSDVTDFGSAYKQQCTPEDQQKMINVGKHHCLFDYGGVPGPETTQWILYTYGDKNRWNYQDCTYQTTFWGAGTACTTGAANYSTCKSWYGAACSMCGIGICPDYCKDLDSFCYGQTLGGHGGQDCGGVTGGNNVIFKGNVNCCFASTISKLITKAAFDQHIGGRPSLSSAGSLVALFRGTEVCTVAELANGTCNPGNTGLATQNTFQALCERGVEMSEMQKIDFSKVDFTDFFNEINQNMNTSNFDQNSQAYQNQKNRIVNDINSKSNSAVKSSNYFNY